ncbi:MAG TPA: glutathione S-transferase family protein [Candidatus Acidoferrales bacterium]|nr:glutathione S-transferase family protein [Candidatus Acidoferrales bacterium]
MIVFYGSPMSSAGRTHWMLEEVGVPYDYKRISLRDGDNKKPEFLKVSPGGKIPCLVDGNVTLTESMAINFYLAEKYGKGLMPTDAVERAHVYEWSFWAITNVQPLFLAILLNTMIRPEAERDAKAVDAARQQIPPYVDFLNRALQGKEYLVGNRFTVADLNAASVIGLGSFVGVDFSAYANVQAWSSRVQGRPAFAKSMD